MMRLISLLLITHAIIIAVCTCVGTSANPASLRVVESRATLLPKREVDVRRRGFCVRQARRPALHARRGGQRRSAGNWMQPRPSIRVDKQCLRWRRVNIHSHHDIPLPDCLLHPCVNVTTCFWCVLAINELHTSADVHCTVCTKQNAFSSPVALFFE